MPYTKSALEDWVNTRYRRMGLKTPQDINLERIARIYSIYLHYEPMDARYDIFGRYRAIVLDSRSTIEEQREQFFHELCHILRHVGHQSMMPNAFRELQEWDANLFTMYAALPYYMVKEYDFEDPLLIQNLANDFKVTEELCEKRMDHIKRNIMFQSQLVAESKTLYT